MSSLDENQDPADALQQDKPAGDNSKKFLSYLGYFGLVLAGIATGLVVASVLSGGSVLNPSSEIVEETTVVETLPLDDSGSKEVLITTQGSSRVSQEADVIVINGTITAFGLTSKEALDQADTAYTLLNSYLAEEGLNPAATVNISVIPEYDENKRETIKEEIEVTEFTPELVDSEDLVSNETAASAPYGYTARQSFTINSEQKETGSLLRSIASISPFIEINYISQELSSPEDLTKKALELAVKDSESKANQYAKMLGLEIITVRAITERNSQSSPIVAYSEAAGGEFKPVDVDVLYNVEIIFVGKPFQQ